MILKPNSQIGLRAESGVHGPKQDLQWGISLLYNIFAPCKATKEAIVRILVKVRGKDDSLKFCI